MAAETRRVALAVAFGFYAALEQRLQPSYAGRPVAVVHRGRVFDLSPEARSKDLLPGLRRANFIELCPEACLVTYEAERYEEGWSRLLDVCARHVPAVEPLDPPRAFLDVGGLDSGAACGRIAAEALAEVGVPVGFGVGPTKVVAWAAALELERVGPARPGRILDASGGPGKPSPQDFLGALPVSHLYPFSADVLSTLERLGLGTIGAVESLTVTELARQFGWPLARRLAAASSGGEKDPVRPSWPPRSFEVTMRFEGGLGGREALDQALARAADRLAAEMTAQGLASSEVSLALWGEWGHRAEDLRRLPRSVRARSSLVLALSHLADGLLDGWPEPDPPVKLRARVGRALPRPGQQLTFSHALSGGREDIRQATDLLARRFGGKVVRGPEEGGPYRRSRRESLLAYYDPLRARTDG